MKSKQKEKKKKKKKKKEKGQVKSLIRLQDNKVWKYYYYSTNIN